MLWGDIIGFIGFSVFGGIGAYIVILWYEHRLSDEPAEEQAWRKEEKARAAIKTSLKSGLATGFIWLLLHSYSH
jgi:hypothetical protein